MEMQVDADAKDCPVYFVLPLAYFLHGFESRRINDGWVMVEDLQTSTFSDTEVGTISKERCPTILIPI